MLMCASKKTFSAPENRDRVSSSGKRTDIRRYRLNARRSKRKDKVIEKQTNEEQNCESSSQVIHAEAKARKNQQHITHTHIVVEVRRNV